MVITCFTPGCNARALVTWLRDPEWVAYYCGHHSDERADTLVVGEWVQVEDEREEWVVATVG